MLSLYVKYFLNSSNMDFSLKSTCYFLLFLCCLLLDFSVDLSFYPFSYLIESKKDLLKMREILKTYDSGRT